MSLIFSTFFISSSLHFEGNKEPDCSQPASRFSWAVLHPLAPSSTTVGSRPTPYHQGISEAERQVQMVLSPWCLDTLIYLKWKKRNVFRLTLYKWDTNPSELLDLSTSEGNKPVLWASHVCPRQANNDLLQFRVKFRELTYSRVWGKNRDRRTKMYAICLT